MLHHFGLRQEAFPLDWLVTIDQMGFLLMLEENFAHFMDEKYLVQRTSTSVINTYYNIDLRHDWTGLFELEFLEIKEKYQRRIKRFDGLNKRKEKVFFIRTAFDQSHNTLLLPLTPYFGIITCEDAKNLRDALLKQFHSLDFNLLIINYMEDGAPSIQGLDRVTEFKISKVNKEEGYKNMIDSLLNNY